MSQSHDPLDQEQQEAAQREQALAVERETQVQQDDTRWLMSTKRGRRIVWRLLEVSGVNRISFNADAMVMAFNEGNRNFGNQFLAEITSLCPDRYLEMLKEQRNHARSEPRTGD